MKADLKEAKTQENSKLQSDLQDVQRQFKEAKDLLLKEREATKKLAEQAPVIQEVSVIDLRLMDKLATENEKLIVRSLVGNKHVTSDRARDKQDDLQGMESTLKELLASILDTS